MYSIQRNEQRHLGGYVEKLNAFGQPTGGFSFDNCHRNAALQAGECEFSASLPSRIFFKSAFFYYVLSDQ